MGAFPQKSVTPYNAVSYSCIFLTKYINDFHEYQIIFKKQQKNPPKNQNPTNQSRLTKFRLTCFLPIQNRKCQSLLFFKEWVMYLFSWAETFTCQISAWNTVSQTMYCIFELSWFVSVCQQELHLWAYVQPHHYCLKGLVFPLKLSEVEDSELPRPLRFF